MWNNNVNNNEAAWALQDPAGDNQTNSTNEYDEYNAALHEQALKARRAKTTDDALTILANVEEICDWFLDDDQFQDALASSNLTNNEIAKTLSDEEQADFQRVVVEFGHHTFANDGLHFINIDAEDVLLVIDALYA